MRKIKVHYPWQHVGVNARFFVPSLNPLETKSDGLRAAMHYNMKGTCSIGVKGGKVGVLFTRVR